MPAPRGAVREHAASQSPLRRRSLGSHATPDALASRLVELALAHLGRIPTLVVDPSCGAGSFLLAVADALVARGVEPAAALGCLGGCDVDPAALRHCIEALRRWAALHEVGDEVGSRILQLDPLLESTPFGANADLVVGNPPFLAQRTVDTARDARRRDAMRARFGELGPYVDDAAAFLLVGAGLLAPGGVCVMIEPQSFLSARDATAVRDRLLADGHLVGLWADAEHHFDADVEVCAPILRRPLGPDEIHSRASSTPLVEVHWGGSPLGPSVPVPAQRSSWGALLAAGLGVPAVAAGASAPDRVLLGEVAVVTAGFRDEFYALARSARVEGEPGWAADAPRLVTSGMIDVASLDTETPRRLAGRRVVSPRLDLDSLSATSGRVSGWGADRMVPKALVATQTRVPEAVADPTGSLIPVTPVISVEPRLGERIDPWHLVAALSAPSLAASAASERAGSGLSSGTFRLTASWVRSVPLPVDRDAWSQGALLVRELHTCPPSERTRLLRELGRTMELAHGRGIDAAILEWWLARADRRPGGPTRVVGVGSER